MVVARCSCGLINRHLAGGRVSFVLATAVQTGTLPLACGLLPFQPSITESFLFLFSFFVKKTTKTKKTFPALLCRSCICTKYAPNDLCDKKKTRLEKYRYSREVRECHCTRSCSPCLADDIEDATSTTSKVAKKATKTNEITRQTGMTTPEHFNSKTTRSTKKAAAGPQERCERNRKAPPSADEAAVDGDLFWESTPVKKKKKKKIDARLLHRLNFDERKSYCTPVQCPTTDRDRRERLQQRPRLGTDHPLTRQVQCSGG